MTFIPIFFQVIEVSISTKSTFLRCVWVSHIVHPDWKRPPPHFCDVFVWYFMLDFKNNIKQCLRFNDSVEVERHSYNFLLLSWLWAYNNRKENCKIWSLTNKTPILYSFTVLANHLKLNFHFRYISFCIPNCSCKTTLSRRFTKMPLWLFILLSVPLAENFYLVSSCPLVKLMEFNKRFWMVCICILHTLSRNSFNKSNVDVRFRRLF